MEKTNEHPIEEIAEETVAEDNDSIMEESETVEKKKGLSSKILGGLKSGLQKGGQKISEGVGSIKEKIKDHKDAVQLEKDIVAEFNKLTQSFTLIVPMNNGKTKNKKVLVLVDYDKKLLTLLGDVKISKELYFVDRNNFKWNVSLVRASQKQDVQVGEVVYPRTVTVVECKIDDDAETIKQVTTIINNSVTDNSITIGDNNDISKSEIG